MTDLDKRSFFFFIHPLKEGKLTGQGWVKECLPGSRRNRKAGLWVGFWSCFQVICLPPILIMTGSKKKLEFRPDYSQGFLVYSTDFTDPLIHTY